MLLRLGAWTWTLGVFLGLGARLYEQMLKPMLWRRHGGRSEIFGGLNIYIYIIYVYIIYTSGRFWKHCALAASISRFWARNDYVAVWLGMGPRWLVYLCEATGDAMRQSLKSRDTVQRL